MNPSGVESSPGLERGPLSAQPPLLGAPQHSPQPSPQHPVPGRVRRASKLRGQTESLSLPSSPHALLSHPALDTALILVPAGLPPAAPAQPPSDPKSQHQPQHPRRPIPAAVALNAVPPLPPALPQAASTSSSSARRLTGAKRSSGQAQASTTVSAAESAACPAPSVASVAAPLAVGVSNGPAAKRQRLNPSSLSKKLPQPPQPPTTYDNDAILLAVLRRDAAASGRQASPSGAGSLAGSPHPLGLSTLLTEGGTSFYLNKLLPRIQRFSQAQVDFCLQHGLPIPETAGPVAELNAAPLVSSSASSAVSSSSSSSATAFPPLSTVPAAAAVSDDPSSLRLTLHRPSQLRQQSQQPQPQQNQHSLFEASDPAAAPSRQSKRKRLASQRLRLAIADDPSLSKLAGDADLGSDEEAAPRLAQPRDPRKSQRYAQPQANGLGSHEAASAADQMWDDAPVGEESEPEPPREDPFGGLDQAAFLGYLEVWQAQLSGLRLWLDAATHTCDTLKQMALAQRPR